MCLSVGQYPAIPDAGQIASGTSKSWETGITAWPATGLLSQSPGSPISSCLALHLRHGHVSLKDTGPQSNLLCTNSIDCDYFSLPQATIVELYEIQYLKFGHELHSDYYFSQNSGRRPEPGWPPRGHFLHRSHETGRRVGWTGRCNGAKKDQESVGTKGLS